MAAKRFKIGNIQLKKDGSGHTVALGSKSKDPRYQVTVQIRALDSQGNVLGQAENGFLSIVDPRDRKDKDGNPLTQEQQDKIPSWIKQELYLTVVDDNN